MTDADDSVSDGEVEQVLEDIQIELLKEPRMTWILCRDGRTLTRGG